MKFKTSLSFNRVDTAAVRTTDGRLRIVLGVDKRCRSILNLFRDNHGRNLERLKEELDDRYSTGDIKYAIKRLIKSNIITKHRGLYRLNNRGLDRWNESVFADLRVNPLRRPTVAA